MGPLCPCHPILQSHTLHEATWKQPPPAWRPCRVPLGNCPEPSPIHIAYVRTCFLSSGPREALCPVPSFSALGAQQGSHWGCNDCWLQLRIRNHLTRQQVFQSCPPLPCLAAGNTGLQEERTLEEGCLLTPIVTWPWILWISNKTFSHN